MSISHLSRKIIILAVAIGISLLLLLFANWTSKTLVYGIWDSSPVDTVYSSKTDSLYSYLLLDTSSRQEASRIHKEGAKLFLWLADEKFLAEQFILTQDSSSQLLAATQFETLGKWEDLERRVITFAQEDSLACARLWSYSPSQLGFDYTKIDNEAFLDYLDKIESAAKDCEYNLLSKNAPKDIQ